MATIPDRAAFRGYRVVQVAPGPPGRPADPEVIVGVIFLVDQMTGDVIEGEHADQSAVFHHRQRWQPPGKDHAQNRRIQRLTRIDHRAGALQQRTGPHHPRVLTIGQAPIDDISGGQHAQEPTVRVAHRNRLGPGAHATGDPPRPPGHHP